MHSISHTSMQWAYDEDDARIYYDDGDVQPTIAYVEREGVAPEQVRADGYLLAAAPVLREEAKADIGLLGFLEEQLNICIDNFSDWQQKDTKRFLADMREAIGIRIIQTNAAIQKATGGTSSPYVETINRQSIVELLNEVDCRIEHGATSNGHLGFVRDQLRAALDGGAHG